MARVLCVLLHHLPERGQEQEKLEQRPQEAATLQKRYQGPQELSAKLLRWAYRLSPVVALDPMHCVSGREQESCYLPDRWHAEFGACAGLTLDVTGTERLFRGERRLLARVQAELKQFGLQTRACIAPTLGAAWALAHFGKEDSAIIAGSTAAQVTLNTLSMGPLSTGPLSTGSLRNGATGSTETSASIGGALHKSSAGLRKHLEPLPIEALRLSEKTVFDLHQLNIHRIKDLLALPRRDLYQRFAVELPKRINQMLGLEQEVTDAVEYVPLTKSRRSFESPLGDREVISFHLKEMLGEVLKNTDPILKVSRLVVELKEINQPVVCKEILLSRPSNDPKHLWKLLQTKIEQLFVCEGIEWLGLYVPSTEPFAATNSSFLPPSPASKSANPLQQAPFAQLIDSLCEQLGRTNVLYLEPAATHVPENVTRFIPADHLPRTTAAQHSCELAQADRPSILFYQPHPISAMAVMPDTPPFWLKWKDTTYRIITGIGPERVAPQWWGEDQDLRLSRDYFKVQLPCGTWLWIYREITKSAWFLHGIWV